jgi:hypothetical protein
MGKPDTAAQNRDNMLTNGRKARALYNKTWNIAAKAPIFCKTTKVMGGPEGKTPIKKYRTARLINTHAYNIAASGAGLYAGRVLANDCEAVRIGAIKENTRAPWAPTVSKGARMVIEQFLCALAQEAAYKACSVKDGVASGTMRLNKTHMRIGWDATIAAVFAADTLVPQTLITAQMPSAEEQRAARKAKKEKRSRAASTKAHEPADEDDDYAPPADEERGSS